MCRDQNRKFQLCLSKCTEYISWASAAVSFKFIMYVTVIGPRLQNWAIFRYLPNNAPLLWSLDFGIYFSNLTFNFKIICNYYSWKCILIWISYSEWISVGCWEWGYVTLILIDREVHVMNKVFVFQSFQVLHFHVRVGAVLNIDTWGSPRFASLCCSTDKLTRMFSPASFV